VAKKIPSENKDEKVIDGDDLNEAPAKKSAPGEKVKSRKPWLSYQWIVKNVPFFLFLSALAVLYIFNGHYSDKTIKDINKTAKEVRELEFEYKSLKSEVMFRSKQSELARAVEPLGLKELTQPPIILRDSTE
jgi:hypothetical protein